METIKKMFMSICLSILIVNMFLVLAMVGIMTGVHVLFWFFGWAVVGSSAATIALAVWTLIRVQREESNMVRGHLSDLIDVATRARYNNLNKR